MGLWALMMVLLILWPWKLVCAHLRRRRARSLLVDPLHLHLDPFLQINTFTTCAEFAFLCQRSMEMGTLRTFAIPSISRTLLKSGEYTGHTSKRYDDTEILIREFTLHHVDSLRGSLALRRLNFLHSHYAISNADYLYVLSLFMTLPPEWASMYGYREWTELEKSSYYKLWHSIATRMGIRDIPSTLADASMYRDDYEVKHMVYADSNHEIAEFNIKVFLNEFPAFLRPLARMLMYSFMDNRLREALGYPEQPSWLGTLLHNLMKLHGLVVMWMPPCSLASVQKRIIPDCPAVPSMPGKKHDNDDDEAAAAAAADTVRPLAFQRYKPITYKEGYKISELGGLKPGKLGDVCEGPLLCPLQKCSNVMWPEVALSRCKTSRMTSLCSFF